MYTDNNNLKTKNMENLNQQKAIYYRNEKCNFIHWDLITKNQIVIEIGCRMMLININELTN